MDDGPDSGGGAGRFLRAGLRVQGSSGEHPEQGTRGCGGGFD
jgi:hypothetical protein